MKAFRMMLMLGVAASACHRGGEAESAPPPMPVQAEKVARGDVVRSVEVAGELGAPPGKDVKLSPLTAGRLAEVRVGEGDRVSQGQLLARLDAGPLRDAVAQAEAQLAQASAQEANARAKLQRAQAALKMGIASAQEVEDDQLGLASAQSAVAAAAAARSTARNQLGRSELRAPFPGLVAHILAAPGEAIDANRAVVEVVDARNLELRGPVAPKLAAELRAGMAAELRIDGLGAASFPGRVAAVSPTVDPATGAALVRVSVDNPGGLRVGAFGHAHVALEERRGVLRVPKAAVLAGDGGEGSAVEIIEGGKSHKVPVELGAQDDRYAEIRSGLAEGAEVIVQGAYALPEGTPVAVTAAAEAGREGSLKAKPAEARP